MHRTGPGFLAIDAAVDRAACMEDDLEPLEAGRLLQAEYGNAAPSLQSLKHERRLFSVICGGLEVYPAFQWHDGRLIPALQALLRVLGPHLTCWKILSWLTTPSERLGGARPADVLPFQPSPVLVIARCELRARRRRCKNT